MESDKAVAIGKIIAIALSPARQLMSQVIARASSPIRPKSEIVMQNLEVQPADGRGKSPGSRKTQFKPGHARMGGRRKAKPDPLHLLDQVCSGLRGSKSLLKLDALKSKVEELNHILSQNPGMAVASRQVASKPIRPEPVQESKPQPAVRKEPLIVTCRGCLGRVSIDRSLLKPGAFIHHACGARTCVALDGSISWF
jgi:hypothetical protein